MLLSAMYMGFQLNCAADLLAMQRQPFVRAEQQSNGNLFTSLQAAKNFKSQPLKPHCKTSFIFRTTQN